MITEELRNYITLFNDDWNADRLFEMANVSPKRHGIDNVFIWVGRKPGQHGLRVKVSRILDKAAGDDSFVIMMPSLDYDPSQVPNWISNKKMSQILEWIKFNQKLLADYENGLIDDADDFMNQISKV